MKFGKKHLLLVVLALIPWLCFALGATPPTPPAAAPAASPPAAAPAAAPAVAVVPAPVQTPPSGLGGATSPGATSPGATTPGANIDRLKEAMESVGMTKADLGIRPKGYWYRYPDRVPYKMHFFDSLYAEPLRIYEFTRIMADCLGDNITLDKFQKDAGSLYRALFYLGVDQKIGGHRAFGANLDPDLPEKAPLLWAAKQAYDAAGNRMRQVIFSGVWPGKKVDWPDPEADIIKQTKDLDPRLERIVANLLTNLVEAYKWRQTALRKVDGKLLREVWEMRGFTGHSSDTQGYPYQVDDLMKQLDEESLYYAALKTAQASQDAARELKELVDKEPAKFKDVHIEFPTPLGRVVVSGTGDDKHVGDNYLILIDLGGNDMFDGAVGATSSLDNPISVSIALSGNHTYKCTSGGPTQGAGIFGVGVLIDVGGDDTFDAGDTCQGFGCFGTGMLVHYKGNDKFTAGHSAQGAAYFGIGLCLHGAGNNTYYALGDCQGFGGPNGVGVLGDVSGSNTYTAEPSADKAGRPDYHSPRFKFTTSAAQGCGSGIRADGANGHAWAGGLGTLLNLGGGGKYEAAHFAQGCGYWFGTGILYDGGSNASYHARCYSISSGCHFAIGSILSEGGNNRYVTDDECEVSIGSGRDFEVSLLLNKAGHNYFQGPGRCVNFSEIRSTALLINLGGENTYVAADGPESLNAAHFDPDMAKFNYRASPSGQWGNCFAILLDIGGKSKFLTRDFKTQKDTPSAVAGDGKKWFKPAKGTKEFGYRNFGIGVSVPDGTVDGLLLLPKP